MAKKPLHITQSDDQVTLAGYLTRPQGDTISRELRALSLPHEGHLILNFTAVDDLDTVGAWQVQQFIVHCQAQGLHVVFAGIKDKFQNLLQLVQKNEANISKIIPQHDSSLVIVGKQAMTNFRQIKDYIKFVGELWLAFTYWLKQPKLIRWPAIFYSIQQDGHAAIPIVALLSFLIGIVLAYQIGTQLQAYGANIYIVDLLGMSVLREFSPLLTAIIVAGRTGSAYTAQIGTMKLNEELDALKTFGLSPNQLIVLPKLIGLAIALPLITVMSEVFSLLGGMIMSKAMLDITFADFLKRFSTEIGVSTYVIGLIKTPIFAVLIASIGCFQGYRVTNSAESVGRQTTISVVQGIFMIIVADAGFSILYTWLGL